MKAQAVSPHAFIWYALLFFALVVVLVAMLSRSAANDPQQPPAEGAVGTEPAPAN